MNVRGDHLAWVGLVEVLSRIIDPQDDGLFVDEPLEGHNFAAHMRSIVNKPGATTFRTPSLAVTVA
jgi:hypothetical protein